jgi:hypothetical protein
VFGRGLKRYLEKRDEEFRVWAQERDEAFRTWTQDREEAFKRWTREREEKFEELREESREFNREILLRNEKVYTSMIVQMEETRNRSGQPPRPCSACSIVSTALPPESS